MSPDLLHVVAVIYNPIRWATRITHYRNFEEHMIAAGVKLTTVECGFGERPFEVVDRGNGVRHVKVRARTLAWNKECLVNIGIRSLPHDARYIAWIDADISFHNPKWAEETVHALQQYPVVQPWTHAIDLGPAGEPMFVKGTHVQTSFAKVWHDLGSIDAWFKAKREGAAPEDGYPLEYSYPHPGYAWAARRETLESLGLLVEASGLGAGDHQMAMGFVGNIAASIHSQTNPVYQAMIRAWGERAHRIVGGRISAVGGMISHHFHGEKSKRKYQERWQTLIDHDFNPLSDLVTNMHGVVELAGNKPKMEMDFDRYNRQRDEDANVRAA